MDKHAYILRGLPGSGKSTLAKTLAPEEYICSTDDFRMVDGKYVFDLAKNGEHHQQNFQKFVGLLKEGAPRVVCDNTNTQFWEFERYIEASVKHGYKVHVITVGAPKNKSYVAFCAKRNTHNVPLEAIERMSQRFEI